jgi:hypothetical protein
VNVVSQGPRDEGLVQNQLVVISYTIYCWASTVLPHLISGQFVEHCKPSFLQSVQPASSLPLVRDIQAHSLVTLVRDPRLSSAARSFE